MGFAENVARAKSRGHDARRKLFLRRNATNEQYGLRLYGGNSLLGEITKGWNLGQDEKIEFQTGARYYPLYIDLIDDPNGDLFRALKAMTKVKIGSVDFKFLSKPTFLAAVPSYTFKVQVIGES
jgi:hypothetical protein